MHIASIQFSVVIFFFATVLVFWFVIDFHDQAHEALFKCILLAFAYFSLIIRRCAIYLHIDCCLIAS